MTRRALLLAQHVAVLLAFLVGWTTSSSAVAQQPGSLQPGLLALGPKQPPKQAPHTSRLKKRTIPTKRRAEIKEEQGWGVKFLSLLGLIVLMGVAFLFNRRFKDIDWRIVLWGVGLQFALALFILKVPWGVWLFDKMKGVINATLEFTLKGSEFLFGSLVNPKTSGFIFAFQVLPTIIFVSSLFSVLFYLGIIQRIVKGLARGMTWLMGISGAEALATAANVFIGQTEAPLVIAPYVKEMTKSELMLLMTGGFATVAGGVMALYVLLGIDAGHVLAASLMSAPAAVVCAKLMVPERETPKTAGKVEIVIEIPDANVIEAATRGASDGLRLAVNVGAMLLAFIALVFLVNAILGSIGGLFGLPQLSLEWLFGWIFWGFAWVMGVPTDDCYQIAQLFGTKMVLNEVLAYQAVGPFFQDFQYLQTIVAKHGHLFTDVAATQKMLLKMLSHDNLLQHNDYLRSLAAEPDVIHSAFMVKASGLTGLTGIKEAVEKSQLLKLTLGPALADPGLMKPVLAGMLKKPEYYLNLTLIEKIKAFQALVPQGAEAMRAYADRWDPAFSREVIRQLKSQPAALEQLINANLASFKSNQQLYREIMLQLKAPAGGLFMKDMLAHLVSDARNFQAATFNMLNHPAVHMHKRSFIIATYALCGFANFSSIAIQIGGIGSIAPERRHDLARLGFPAMIGGALAAFMTATIAGVLT